MTWQSFTDIKFSTRWHCGEFRVYAENGELDSTVLPMNLDIKLFTFTQTENGEDACSILVTVTAPPSPPGKCVVVDISETRWDEMIGTIIRALATCSENRIL